MSLPYSILKVFFTEKHKITELYEKNGKKADKSEKLIQDLIEHNLSTIFPNLEFLATEHTFDKLRPDSIAFDNKINSFVIIEYKNVKHKGLVDQGMSYYNLVQKQKASFVLLYQDIKEKILNRKNVHWDKTKIIFIAPEFTEHQRRSTQDSSVSLPIELYKISKWDNGIILLDTIGGKKDKKIADKIKLGNKEPSEYSEDAYLIGEYDTAVPSEQTRKIYFKMKNLILSTFSGIEYKQKSKYVKFYSKKNNSVICTIEVQKDKLKLSYSVSEKNIIPINSFVRDMTGIGHLGLGNYMSKIKTETDIEKAIPLIEKAYNFNVK